MNGNKIMDSSIKNVVRKFSAAAAAIMIMSGSAVGALALDPGLPGDDVAAEGTSQLLNGTSVTLNIPDTDTQPADTSSVANAETGANDMPAPITDNTTSESTASVAEESQTAQNTETPEKTEEKNTVKLAKGVMKSETKFNNGNTHPWGKQTSTLKVRWENVSGAQYYQLVMKGGKYTKWTVVRNFPATMTSCTLAKLDRDTSYKFKVRAYADGKFGTFSSVQTLRTARIDFDQNGWKAMCRIVYHEVGRADGDVWNEPIVHVADCVVNRYEAAKYLNDPLWSPYYSGYGTVQDMIYKSGGFMSSEGLTADGVSYDNVSSRVRSAVYGAVYNKATVNSIKHNKKVYYWMNGYSKPTSKKCAYVYEIPWGGYFSIWSEYWG